MRTSALLSQIAAAIKTDAALNAWCLENFRRAPEVRIGMDAGKPPESESYPVATIFRVSHSRAVNSKRQSWVVMLGVGVEAPGEETTDDGVIVIGGELLAEDFRELAEEAVFKARLGKVEPSSDVPEGIPLPFHMSWSTLQIEMIT